MGFWASGQEDDTDEEKAAIAAENPDLAGRVAAPLADVNRAAQPGDVKAATDLGGQPDYLNAGINPRSEAFYKYANTRSGLSDDAARNAAAAENRGFIRPTFNPTGSFMQNDAYQQYRDAARGLGPSQAPAALQGANDALYRQQAMAQAQAHGGLQQSQAARMAMMGALNGGQANAMHAGQLAGQEQNAAMQGMGAVSNAMHGQDIEQGIRSAQAELRNRGLNDAQAQYFHDLEVRRRLALGEANIGQEQAIARGTVHRLGGDVNNAIANNARSSALTHDLVSAGAGASTALVKTYGGGSTDSRRDDQNTYGGSDERFKTGTESADSSIRQTLDSLHPYSYEYKDPEKHGQGRRFGIMAQDMEKTGLGRSVVQNRHDGKYIDLNKATSLSLAGIASLNRRLDALERSDSDDE